MFLTACAQKKGGERGPRQGGGMSINKDSDSTFVALKNETLKKFKQLTFKDAKTGKTMAYNLLVPEGYDGKASYPLVLFMADAFVLVPQYTEWAVQDDWSTTDEVEMTIRLLQSVCKEYNVDTNRLYTTGQSMGGMMSFYFNITHPDMFAASLFVSCQWDTSKMKDFGQKRFFYIVAGGDEKASGGMRNLSMVLKEQNVKVDSATWSAKLPQEEQERLAEELIAKGNTVNFIKFEKGTVLPESGKGMEHMASFDYAYKIAAVRDWLFEQSK